MRKDLIRLAAAIGGVSLTVTACGGVETSTSKGGDGDDYPSGTVEMYVGASAGGSSDLISRAVSKGLSNNLHASFPVAPVMGVESARSALVSHSRVRRHQ